MEPVPELLQVQEHFNVDLAGYGADALWCQLDGEEVETARGRPTKVFSCRKGPVVDGDLPPDLTGAAVSDRVHVTKACSFAEELPAYPTRNEACNAVACYVLELGPYGTCAPDDLWLVNMLATAACHRQWQPLGRVLLTVGESSAFPIVGGVRLFVEKYHLEVAHLTKGDDCRSLLGSLCRTRWGSVLLDPIKSRYKWTPFSFLWRRTGREEPADPAKCSRRWKVHSFLSHVHRAHRPHTHAPVCLNGELVSMPKATEHVVAFAVLIPQLPLPDPAEIQEETVFFWWGADSAGDLDPDEDMGWRL